MAEVTKLDGVFKLDLSEDFIFPEGNSIEFSTASGVSKVIEASPPVAGVEGVIERVQSSTTVRSSITGVACELQGKTKG